MAIIYGTTGDDRLNGSSSADEIYGLEGHDILEGAAGDDVLIGGIGNDIYVYRPGAGRDVIAAFDGGGFDTLQIQTLLPSQVYLFHEGLDLVVRFAGTSDQITVAGFFDPALAHPPIERIAFGSGTIWEFEAILNRVSSGNSNVPTEAGDTLAGTPNADVVHGLGGNDTISGDAGSDQIFGGDGDDSLFGDAGDDLLVGGAGNDLLRGSSGNDTLHGGIGDDVYAFVPGFGTDTVFEEGGFDTLFLTTTNTPDQATIDPQSVRLYRSGDDLIVDAGGTVRIVGHFNPTNAGAAIEQIVFADGTVWDSAAIFTRSGSGNFNNATRWDDVIVAGNGNEVINGLEGNDTISGAAGDDVISGDAGNDRLFGNQGNDLLSGGEGNDSLWGNAGSDVLDGGIGSDTYYVNTGDGKDVIIDGNAGGEANRLVFGPGIRLKDLVFQQEGGDLLVHITGSGGSVRLVNTVAPGVVGPRAVESLHFADGTSYSLSNPETIIEGSPWNDWLYGSLGKDRIYGYDGDDYLAGFEGNDTLIGGRGYDQLDGGLGDDTYVFAAGDGFDFVWEGAAVPEMAGGTDTIQLGAGYEPAYTMLERWENHLVIRNAQSGDQILVQEQFGSYLDGNRRSVIEKISFSDGTCWDASAIAARLASSNNNMLTNGNDTIGGFSWDDYLYAMSGNDTVSGGGGNDQIFGGNGNDRLFGGSGNDSLSGESGNDLLAGGTGNDMLVGGPGSDTYLFNSGDGVDSIMDYPIAGEVNRLVFGSGIHFQDLRAEYDPFYSGTAIHVGTGGDRIHLIGSFPDPYGPRAIDLFEFADGTVATFDALTGYGVFQWGTDWDDWQTGTGFADSLYGGGGRDLLHGQFGNDILAGGRDNDTLIGGSGNDTYLFNRGDGVDFIDDFALPTEGNRVRFGSGISVEDLRLRYDGWGAHLDVGTEGDALFFSNFFPLDPMTPYSVETYEFADGTTLSHAGLLARGFYFDGSEWYGDYLIGTVLNDHLYGHGSDDTLIGMEGDDRLIGGTGYDQMYGGPGSDTYVFNAGDGFDIVWDGAGMPFEDRGYVDTVRLENGYDPAMTMLERWENDLIIRNAQSGDQIFVREHFGSYYDGNTRSAIEQITFSDGTVWDNAAIRARLATMNSNLPTDGDDTIGGLPWSDYFFAAGGNDTVSGGEGDDQISGGEGNDRLFGGGGQDFLFGDSGDDLLAGGSRNDLLSGGAGNDTYVFNLGDGVDTIQEIFAPGEINEVQFGAGIRFEDLSAYVNYGQPGIVITVASQGDVLHLPGSAPDPYVPHDIDFFRFADGTTATFDALIGYGAYLQGGAGSDYLSGTFYADSLYGNDGNDNLIGFNGHDILSGGSGEDILHGEEGDDALYGGSGNDMLLGGAGSDLLDGGDGADHLQGGDGVDVLIGGAGDDLLLGDSGGDRYHVGRSTGFDRIDERYSFPGGGDDTDRVYFDASIAPGDLVVSHGGADGRDLLVEVGSGGATQPVFAVTGWFDTNYSGKIEEFVFADGSVLTTAQIEALANRAPVVNQPAPDVLATEDSAFLHALPANTFADQDPGDALTYTATQIDGAPLPAWLAFDPASLRFSGVPGNAEVGGIAVRVTATDSFRLSASTAFTITVRNVNDAPAANGSVPFQLAMQDQTFSLSLDQSLFADDDAIHGDVLTLGASLVDGSPLPAWLSFDPVNRVFSGTPANGDVGLLTVRVTATDLSGASAGSDFQLYVANVNDAPVVANPLPEQTAAEGANFSFLLPANTFEDSDIIHGDALALSATLADGSPLPAWLSFDAVTRTFSGSPSDGTAGVYAVRVTATDGAGASASDEFRLDVADAIATVVNGTAGVDVLQGTAFRDVLYGLGSNDTLYGHAGDDLLDGGAGSDAMYGGAGNDTYVVNGTGDVVVEYANEGVDTVLSSVTYTLGSHLENLTLTGTSNRSGTGNGLDNVLIGNAGNNTLTGNAGNDTLDGGAGSDTLRGGTGDDTYVFARGYGADTVSENDATAGNRDTVMMGANALDVLFARSASSLVMSLHGGTDRLTVSNWYGGSQYQTEVIRSTDGRELLNTQVDQLIQAMAQFSSTTGLTWDQAVSQRPQEVEAILSAYWQPSG